MFQRRVLTSCLLASCCVFTSSSSWALDLDSVQLTPYAWATGVKGKVSPFKSAPSVHIDKKFSDVMKSLEGGGFLQLRLRKQDYIMFADAMFVSTRESQRLSGVPLINTVGSRLDSKQFTVAIMPGYRVWHSPRASVELLLGARYWHVSNRLMLEGGAYQGQHKESMSWVDPEFGVRLYQRLGDSWSALAQASIGGWDAAARESGLVQASLNYAMGRNWTASLGYRYQKVNYKRHGHIFNVRMSGPAAGVTWSF